MSKFHNELDRLREERDDAERRWADLLKDNRELIEQLGFGRAKKRIEKLEAVLEAASKTLSEASDCAEIGCTPSTCHWTALRTAIASAEVQ